MAFFSRDAVRGRRLCPACGSPVRADPYRLAGEVFCPHCGRRLWFFRLRGEVRLYDPGSVPDGKREQIEALMAWIRESPLNLSGGMDSLDIVEFIMDLEEKLGLETLLEEGTRLISLRDVIDYLERHFFHPDD
jgi:hypothetical protein